MPVEVRYEPDQALLGQLAYEVGAAERAARERSVYEQERAGRKRADDILREADAAVARIEAEQQAMAQQDAYTRLALQAPQPGQVGIGQAPQQRQPLVSGQEIANFSKEELTELGYSPTQIKEITNLQGYQSKLMSNPVFANDPNGINAVKGIYQRLEQRYQPKPQKTLDEQVTEAQAQTDAAFNGSVYTEKTNGAKYYRDNSGNWKMLDTPDPTKDPAFIAQEQQRDIKLKLMPDIYKGAFDPTGKFNKQGAEDAWAWTKEQLEPGGGEAPAGTGKGEPAPTGKQTPETPADRAEAGKSAPTDEDEQTGTGEPQRKQYTAKEREEMRARQRMYDVPQLTAAEAALGDRLRFELEEAEKEARAGGLLERLRADFEDFEQYRELQKPLPPRLREEIDDLEKAQGLAGERAARERFGAPGDRVSESEPRSLTGEPVQEGIPITQEGIPVQEGIGESPRPPVTDEWKSVRAQVDEKLRTTTDPTARAEMLGTLPMGEIDDRIGELRETVARRRVTWEQSQELGAGGGDEASLLTQQAGQELGEAKAALAELEQEKERRKEEEQARPPQSTSAFPAPLEVPIDERIRRLKEKNLASLDKRVTEAASSLRDAETTLRAARNNNEKALAERQVEDARELLEGRKREQERSRAELRELQKKKISKRLPDDFKAPAKKPPKTVNRAQETAKLRAQAMRVRIERVAAKRGFLEQEAKFEQGVMNDLAARAKDAATSAQRQALLADLKAAQQRLDAIAKQRKANDDEARALNEEITALKKRKASQRAEA